MADGPADSIQLIGSKVTFVKMDQGSNYELTEWEVQPGVDGPPVHIHHQHNEGFYVMAGHFGFVLDGITTYARPGTHVLVPMGHEHSFWNAGDRPGRCLLIVSPPGLGQYFRALAANLDSTGSQADSIAIRKRLGETYDVEIVGEVPSEDKAARERP